MASTSSKPWIRLVHAKSGAVSEHVIGRLPAYVAVSHTWSDDLFAPSQSFRDTIGCKALDSLFGREEYAQLRYCWVDTLCIDQSDPEDKHRQIPLMGEIYGDAEFVAILTTYAFGLSQSQIDAIEHSTRDAVEMSANGSWEEHGKTWSESEKHRRRLKQAMDCLEIFTRPTWGSRVWTMQEFILAKRTVWIGADLQPLRVDERLFQAIPDVCDTLSIEECIGGKYAKLYSHFQGMAGAHLNLFDRSRVMELLGNKSATVPEDEVFGLMAASGVILKDVKIKGREKAWSLWWEEAIRSGNFRWALLPHATPMTPDYPFIRPNCMRPAFSSRHLASTNSVLDSVEPYGPVGVRDGAVSMMGRVAGRCEIVQRLGRVHADNDGTVYRDITLILFAGHNWHLALRIAAAFGAGRYDPPKRRTIAQVLSLNYHRAKLAVLQRRERFFRPRFRSRMQFTVWTDFMQLQSIHMRVMNDGVAFLATVSNAINTSTDIIVVTDGIEEVVSGEGSLWALDVGAVNVTEKTMFSIVRSPPRNVSAAGDPSLPPTLDSARSTSLHKVGTSMYLQVTAEIGEAMRYACHPLNPQSPLCRFVIGGDACFVCGTVLREKDDNNRPDSAVLATGDQTDQTSGVSSSAVLASENSRKQSVQQARLHIRRQNHKIRVLDKRKKKKKRVSFVGKEIGRQSG